VHVFVYASGDRGGPELSPINATAVKNFIAKFHIKKYLEGKVGSSPQGMMYTILRPVTFFENLTPDIHGRGFVRMWEQIGDKKLQLVSTRDIGWFGANAFLHHEEYKNIAVTLVGDELSQTEADVIFKEVTGTNMAMAPCLIGKAVKWVKRDTVGDMFEWFEKEGYGGSVTECRKIHPQMMDWRTWLKECSGFVRE